VTLAETQALFHEILTGAEPVAPERIDACFAGSLDLPAAERVAIYANMYLWRLVEALRETFPNLVKYLGDERFAALAEDYLRRNPSEHHDVGQVGRRLAAFLREHPDSERPDLADLAELEWARHQVFFAPPAEPVGPEALAGLDPEAFAGTGLVLSPTLRLLVLDHAAAPLWRRLEDGEAPDAPSPGASAVAVWRSGFQVLHSPLALDEAAALEGAASGESLATICAAFSDREDPPGAAHAALSSWLQEGWIAMIRTTLSRESAEPLPAAQMRERTRLRFPAGHHLGPGASSELQGLRLRDRDPGRQP
jgi:hypothetical protein